MIHLYYFVYEEEADTDTLFLKLFVKDSLTKFMSQVETSYVTSSEMGKASWIAQIPIWPQKISTKKA